GRAIDKNNNGIPDELEAALDRRYAKFNDESSESKSHGNVIHDLINEGYVNVYFKFDSAQPEIYSLEAINYLAKYMLENPSAQAELLGYTDSVGNAEYNSKLSERRAKAVYDVLVAYGVDANRLSYKGDGVDDS